MDMSLIPVQAQTRRKDRGATLLASEYLSEKVRSVVPLEAFKLAENWLAAGVVKSRRKPFADLINVTPALALVLLDRNTSNRKISATGLRRYCSDLEEGRWEVNGETMVIAKDGLMNNGQHRCLAILLTGIPAQIFVAFGVTRNSRLTLDQGVLRNTATYLEMTGVPNAKNAAAVATYIYQYDRNRKLSGESWERPSKTQVRDLAVQYSDSIAYSTGQANRDRTGKLASRSILTFCHWMIARTAGVEAADHFYEQMVIGANLSADDPAFILRRRLLEFRGSRDINSRVELILRAWNAHREGRKVVHYKLLGGPLPEIMP